ncbi:TetR-like C-terminal domain-containing protein [Paenibacillus sp. 2TAB23]|uniref:TetR-like C-terminal domain-containing protein n=1 Tax=Paenibacillus sp. 2TAB23 TaxID=3233004 RepID=UPI003F9A65D0
MLRTIEQIEKNAFFYKIFLGNKGVPSFKIHLREMMNKKIVEQINENNVSLDELRKDTFVQFLSSAIVGVIEWWFTHTTPCSAEEITDQTWSLLELNQLILQSQS